MDPTLIIILVAMCAIFYFFVIRNDGTKKSKRKEKIKTKEKIETLVMDSRVSSIEEISNLVEKPYDEVLEILKELVDENKASVKSSRNNETDVERREFELGNARIDEVNRQFLLPIVIKTARQEQGLKGAVKRAFSVIGKVDYEVIGYEQAAQKPVQQVFPQAIADRCPGCGANILITIGKASECEYCGTTLDG